MWWTGRKNAAIGFSALLALISLELAIAAAVVALIWNLIAGVGAS